MPTADRRPKRRPCAEENRGQLKIELRRSEWTEERELETERLARAEKISGG
jgi:hypothetical protein